MQVFARAVLTRKMAPALVAAALLIVLAVAGILLDQPDWITPLLAVTIIVIGVMYGARGGFLAGLIACAAFVAWAVGHDGYDLSDFVNHRVLLFLALGVLTGYFAHGALGDYHVGQAVARGRIRRAMHHEQLVLYYQPVARADTGRVISLEALVRWDHPTRGIVPPGEFVPVAEGDRVTIWELTLYTLRLAIRECSEWQRQGFDVGVGVNLSSATIHREELIDEISDALSAAKLNPHRLTLEVTESAVMDAPKRVAAALAEVRSEDAAIAIDDFGTGHSSLARLEELPVDTLKIDQTFLKRADEDRRHAVLRSIVDLAHGLGLTACAEGVEDEATWDTLIGLGCDTVQGYAISRPMPADEVGSWLERNQSLAARA